MSWVFNFVRKMVAALKNSTDNLKKISINCKKNIMRITQKFVESLGFEPTEHQVLS